MIRIYDSVPNLREYVASLPNGTVFCTRWVKDSNVGLWLEAVKVDDIYTMTRHIGDETFNTNLTNEINNDSTWEIEEFYVCDIYNSTLPIMGDGTALKKPIKETCECDWIEVLKVGCNCGAIVRFDERQSNETV